MDAARFDAMVRSLVTASRRRALYWLGAGVVSALARPAPVAAACTPPCRPDQVCRNGACRCPRGRTECADPAGGDPQCVDLRTDPIFCGGCAAEACAQGQRCRNGRCRCPRGQTLCTDPVFGDVACFDLLTDRGNCGSCNAACAGIGERCRNGRCRCPAGKTLCVPSDPFIPAECVDLRTEPSHCGACNAACLGVGERCQNGACQCRAGSQAVGIEGGGCGPGCRTDDDCRPDFCYTGCPNCGAGQCEWCDEAAGVCRPGCRSHDYCPDCQLCDMEDTHECYVYDPTCEPGA